jgi:hypothetical protein
VLLPLLPLLLACVAPTDTGALPLVTYTEDRAVCALRSAERILLWGDLHVHGSMSFDARNYGTEITHDQVLAFAQGEAVTLGADRVVQLDRPLDFVALTEHGEYLGELVQCTTPGSPGYGAALCEAYQGGDPDAAFGFGVELAAEEPLRSDEICGEQAVRCTEGARSAWHDLVATSQAAYDTSEACGLTTLPGYEYTRTPEIANQHRVVLFRNTEVPPAPISAFEAPSPWALWRALEAQCTGNLSACDAIVVPHNSNLANGWMYHPSWVEGPEVDLPAAEAWALRARMEPLVEIFQHKGDSECRDGLGGATDPHCDFEKLRPADDEVCDDDELGTGGMRLWGCVHRLDFVRYVLLEGLALGQQLEVNPYRLGVIGSTDTHNGTPGLVRHGDYQGHVGTVDDTVDERLGDGNITHDTFIDNPGGLTAVWAVENSRDALFEALRRREVYATSGPRIALRVFAGELPGDLCQRADAVAVADAAGVPMGGVLGGPLLAAPSLWITAEADPGSDVFPGVGLSELQVVEGRVGPDGTIEERVHTLAWSDDPGWLDSQSCDAGGGDSSFCVAWQPPDFDPQRPTFWYVRVLEVPTCRWSTLQCDSFDDDLRPPRCDEGSVESVVQQRAWSSPIWYEPAG